VDDPILVLFVFLPIVIICIYISLKLGGKYMGKMNNGALIKVIEKVPLSQNAFIAIVTIDGKPYVISCSEKQIQVLMELDEEVLQRARKPLGWTDTSKNSVNLAEILNKVKGRFENEKNN
jgi:flagellar protein FliO/FliZ